LNCFWAKKTQEHPKII
jgi:hypothetical protein